MSRMGKGNLEGEIFEQMNKDAEEILDVIKEFYCLNSKKYEETNKIIFKTEDELLNFIEKDTSITEDYRKRIVNHEKAHFDKAVKLGYSPFYVVTNPDKPFFPEGVKKGKGFGVYTPAVENLEHSKQIALAPENPCYEDYLKIEFIEMFLFLKEREAKNNTKL